MTNCLLKIVLNGISSEPYYYVHKLLIVNIHSWYVINTTISYVQYKQNAGNLPVSTYTEIP